MKRYFISLIFCFLFFGCNTLAHMDQLLTLKELSDDQAKTDRYVAAQNKKFKLLVEAIASDQIKANTHQNTFLRKYGEPIFSRLVEKDGEEVDFWLYRHPAQYFGNEKVYLYFDQNKKLKSWEYIPGVTIKETPSSASAAPVKG